MTGPQRPDKFARIHAMAELRVAGYSWADIGADFDIGGPRAYQLARKHESIVRWFETRGLPHDCASLDWRRGVGYVVRA